MAVEPKPEAIVTPPALPQRGVSGVIGAVLAGCASGLLAWLALTYGAGSPLTMGLILLVPTPLFFVGLGVGRVDILVAAVVAIAALTYFTNPSVMALFAGVYILPVMLLCLLALRYRQDEQGKIYWYPAGRLVAFLVLYPVLVFACFSLMMGEQGVENILYEIFLPWMNELVKHPDIAQKITGEHSDQLAQHMARSIVMLAPCLLIMTWISFISAQALWTQFTLLSNKMALRPMPKLQDFDLPPWLLILFAIMALLAMFFDGEAAYFARNTLLPLTVPYFILGTTLVHLWAGKKKHKGLLLTMFYLVVVGSVYPIPLVALAGVLEPWLHIRQRLSGKARLTV